MNMDTELEVWRRQWQSAAAVPADLRRKVERQSRFMRLMVLTEIVVTIVIGGGATMLAVRSPEPDMIVLASVVWFLFAATWAFALTTRRGLWSPASQSTSAFLDLSIRRCRSRRKAAIFGAVLYCCEMTFCLAWIYQHNASIGSTTVLIVSVVTVLFAIWLIWYRRRIRAELRYLVSLQRETELLS